MSYIVSGTYSAPAYAARNTYATPATYAPTTSYVTATPSYVAAPTTFAARTMYAQVAPTTSYRAPTAYAAPTTILATTPSLIGTSSALQSKPSPKVTVFSSIQEIVSKIESYWPDGPLTVIHDDALCGGAGVAGVHFKFDPANLSTSTFALLADAEILLSEPTVLGDLLAAFPEALPNVKWIQSIFAGVDSIFKSPWLAARPELKLSPPFTLTRFAGKFGPKMAEWVIGEILAWERSFLKMRLDQANKSWMGHGEVCEYRTLPGLTMGIIGCGDIGLQIARLCKALGMTVLGITRKSRSSGEKKPFVDSYLSMDELPKLLRSSDYICNVLPSTNDTRGLLSGDVLKACSKEYGGKCPIFMNVGRGDVISEASLLTALDSVWISGAILDVFEVEPLPKESRLWGMSNVVISPHVSAVSFPGETVEVMKANYQKYVSGETMNHIANWEIGY
eukprot:gnl/MRDRNA2_/MRDRNA2_60975_c0_seq2.p1 gnl/MRDRNA2_/MRDRNA2_60975_c0~~gnl/MRDRNA2_/MRDRNA2_60975_c0_seq2.p1  ORF type:complete len:481 (+),score=55.64 gnl/MRDRNA2_/MRDRNA2_60975_c0_seq2:97-1443(+)